MENTDNPEEKKTKYKEFGSKVTERNERDVDCRIFGVSRHITYVQVCNLANNNNTNIQNKKSLGNPSVIRARI